MKKVILIALFTIGISGFSFSQIGQEQTAKKEGFFHRLFHMRDNRPRKQMHHFDAPKKDPNMKHNGTAFWRRKKKEGKYKVDGDGFSAPEKGGKKWIDNTEYYFLPTDNSTSYLKPRKSLKLE